MKMTKLLTTFLIILVVLFAGCKKDDYIEKIGVCFQVIATDPIDVAHSVPYDQIVSATFNAKVDTTTMDETTFLLNQGSTSILGIVAYTDSTATFTPSDTLMPFTVYTGTIKNTVTSTWGNPMQADHVWSFTTKPQLTIVSSPLLGGTTTGDGVFDEGAIVPVSASPLGGYLFVDWTESGVSQSTSANYNVTMSKNMNLTANFSNDSYTLTAGGTNGSVAKNPDLATYAYNASVQLTATPISSSFVFDSWSGDASGSVNPLDVTMISDMDITANFIPIGGGGGAGAGPGAIDLGGAALYTILSKTGISTTGVTSITGNIGVSPNKAVGITGFGLVMDRTNVFSKSNPTSLVSGKVYASDYAVPTPAKISQAVSDMETAFTTANLKTLSVITELGAGDITGMTLAPGLYKWGTGLLISASGVTLSGSANDTWVFQIGQGLTVANDAHITLSGGAQAKNIFWITASKAEIGSTVYFNGNILSQTEITLKAGSTVKGRLLGQTAVTLDAATVILP